MTKKLVAGIRPGLQSLWVRLGGSLSQSPKKEGMFFATSIFLFQVFFR